MTTTAPRRSRPSTGDHPWQHRGHLAAPVPDAVLVTATVGPGQYPVCLWASPSDRDLLEELPPEAPPPMTAPVRAWLVAYPPGRAREITPVLIPFVWPALAVLSTGDTAIVGVIDETNGAFDNALVLGRQGTIVARGNLGYVTSIASTSDGLLWANHATEIAAYARNGDRLTAVRPPMPPAVGDFDSEVMSPACGSLFALGALSATGQRCLLISNTTTSQVVAPLRTPLDDGWALAAASDGAGVTVAIALMTWQGVQVALGRLGNRDVRLHHHIALTDTTETANSDPLVIIGRDSALHLITTSGEWASVNIGDLPSPPPAPTPCEEPACQN
ncbi:hypothetical protein AB0I28_32105 [Phytomonospora sp. NPDC050363]|uniref:hypothetical protein n=1 Tax=Phytomonospora sp. NPDC050363 TaxID=3155642 RepID=UPI0033FDF587